MATRKRRRAPSPDGATPCRPRFASAAAPAVVATERPVVESIADLYQRFPSVRQARPPDPGVLPTAAAAHPRHPRHREHPDVVPYLVDEFRFLLQQLPVPEFMLFPQGGVGPVISDQTQLQRALCHRRVDLSLRLPVQTAEHEARLLVEAGEWPHPRRPTATVTLPPCAHGARCVGRTEGLRGAPPGGFTLAALLFEPEYDTLLERRLPPVQPRPCVLCYRFHFTDYVLTLRPNAQRVGGVHPGVLQVYRNLVDAPGGYVHEALLHPDPRRFEGFVDPVVRFTHRSLRAERDGGRWRVVQEGIVWTDAAPLVPPPVGTRLGDFGGD